MSTGATVLFELERGAQVTAYQANSSAWLYVRNSSGLEGCIENITNYVKTTAPVAATLIGTHYIDVPFNWSVYVFEEANTGSTKLLQLGRGTRVIAYAQALAARL